MNNRLYKGLLSFMLLTFGAISVVSAQKEIAFSLGRELPLDNINVIFKPATSYGFTYSRLEDRTRGRSFGFDFSLYLFNHKVREDVFYYLVGSEDYGTVRYSDYFMLQLTMGARWFLPLSDKMDLFYGTDLGYYYVKYDLNQTEPGFSSEASNIEGKGAIAPKIGLNYHINDVMGVRFQPQYHVYFLISDRASALPPISYATDLGEVNFALSLRLAYYYRFGF